MADTTRPSEDQRLLTESLELLAPVADALTVAFDERLSTGDPRVRALFGDGFVEAMLALAAGYDHARALVPEFAAMGRRHERYGIRVDEYATVGAVLIGTLRDFAGTAWTPAYQGAWTRAYTFAAGTMMRAAARADEEEQQLAA